MNEGPAEPAGIDPSIRTVGKIKLTHTNCLEIMKKRVVASSHNHNSNGMNHLRRKTHLAFPPPLPENFPSSVEWVNESPGTTTMGHSSHPPHISGSGSNVLTKDYLTAVAQLHLPQTGGDRNSKTTTTKTLMIEARSSISSPGKMNLTLRDKLTDKLATRRRQSQLADISNSILDDSAVEIPVESTVPTAALRMKRKTQIICKGNGGYPLATVPQNNKISIHIYDLISKDTLMQLPWGCVCEVGRCFNELNSTLHDLGTGAYHVGVEVNGVEYAYGATSVPGKTGIFTCLPKLSPGYQYRTTIEFGTRPLVARKVWMELDDGRKGCSRYQEKTEYMDGRRVIKEMIPDYMGSEYDILRKNCCTFARDFCLRLGISNDDIPSWFGNLAESGAMTQDMAYATVEPLRLVLSSCEGDEDGLLQTEEAVDATGFEVIPKSTGKKELIFVVDARRHAASDIHMMRPEEMRRTASWTY